MLFCSFYNVMGEVAREATRRCRRPWHDASDVTWACNYLSMVMSPRLLGAPPGPLATLLSPADLSLVHHPFWAPFRYILSLGTADVWPWMKPLTLSWNQHSFPKRWKLLEGLLFSKDSPFHAFLSRQKKPYLVTTPFSCALHVGEVETLHLTLQQVPDSSIWLIYMGSGTETGSVAASSSGMAEEEGSHVNLKLRKTELDNFRSVVIPAPVSKQAGFLDVEMNQAFLWNQPHLPALRDRIPTLMRFLQSRVSDSDLRLSTLEVPPKHAVLPKSQAIRATSIMFRLFKREVAWHWEACDHRYSMTLGKSERHYQARLPHIGNPCACCGKVRADVHTLSTALPVQAPRTPSFISRAVQKAFQTLLDTDITHAVKKGRRVKKEKRPLTPTASTGSSGDSQTDSLEGVSPPMQTERRSLTLHKALVSRRWSALQNYVPRGSATSTRRFELLDALVRVWQGCTNVASPIYMTERLCGRPGVMNLVQVKARPGECSGLHPWVVSHADVKEASVALRSSLKNIKSSWLSSSSSFNPGSQPASSPGVGKRDGEGVTEEEEESSPCSLAPLQWEDEHSNDEAWKNPRPLGSEALVDMLHSSLLASSQTPTDLSQDTSSGNPPQPSDIYFIHDTSVLLASQWHVDHVEVSVPITSHDDADDVDDGRSGRGRKRTHSDMQRDHGLSDGGDMTSLPLSSKFFQFLGPESVSWPRVCRVLQTHLEQQKQEQSQSQDREMG